MRTRKCKSSQPKAEPAQPFRAAIERQLNPEPDSPNLESLVFSEEDKRTAGMLRSVAQESLRRRGTPIEMPSSALTLLP